MRPRILMSVVTAAAAAGLVLGTTASALATPVIADISYSVVAVQSHTTNAMTGANCTGVLLSEQLTPTGPAYVSGYLENVHAGATCLGWLERSVNSGLTWTKSSSIVIAPNAPGFSDWIKLGEQKDGPGLRARVCFQVGSATKQYCTRGVTLRASTATQNGFPVQLSYIRTHLVVGSPTSQCSAYLSSSTIVKKTTTVADGFFVAFGATCTGYEQTSTNGGLTWTTVSRFFMFTSKAPTTVWSFTAVHPDGTGRIARACVILGAGKAHCTSAW